MDAEVLNAPEINDDSSRDSTRPIRALNRGLDVLTELNRLERAAINTLANAVELPRTTTYRILETLRLAGYVERDPHDDCYRPTIMVRALSDGFDDEAMLAHVARPHLSALCAQIVWPVAIATPSGSAMMIREATDHQSPLALEHYGAGVRVPMLGSAAGRAYLAHCAAHIKTTVSIFGSLTASITSRVYGARLVRHLPGSGLVSGKILRSSAHWLTVHFGGGAKSATHFDAKSSVRWSGSPSSPGALI